MYEQLIRHVLSLADKIKQGEKRMKTNPWFSDKCVQWYTPRLIIDLIKRFLMPIINLDPFSCRVANGVVQADRYYDGKEKGCGFYMPWDALNFFLNPPRGKVGRYSRSDLALRKAIREVDISDFEKQGIVVLRACLGYKCVKNWIQLPHAIIRERVYFIDGSKSAKNNNKPDP